MPPNIYDLMPVLMCGMSWILCTLVSPNSWDHSDGLASARKLHVVTCNFFRDLWLSSRHVRVSSFEEDTYELWKNFQTEMAQFLEVQTYGEVQNTDRSQTTHTSDTYPEKTRNTDLGHETNIDERGSC